jgi:hypothetical protein
VQRRFALTLLLLVPAAGCARCASSPIVDAGPPPAPLLTSVALPPPAPWAFTLVRKDANVALPEHCKLRGPLTHAPVAARTRFLADPRSLGTLAIADMADKPHRLTGVAALTLDPLGASHDPLGLPWYSPGAVPRLARLPQGGWVAGFDQPGSGGLGRVGLFREGTAELLGEGDSFEAIDVACARGELAGGARCALLTSRIGKVAPAGAIVWIGAPGEPAGRWKQVEILPAQSDSDARPFGLGALDVAAGAIGVTATAVLVDKGELVYFAAGDGPPREVGRIPGGHGVIDAAAFPAPVAMTYVTPLDDDGCAREAIDGGGAGIGFQRQGLPEVVVRVPAPPVGGVLRRLDKGGIAAWLAPLGCHQTRRVLYAVVLDAQGTPEGAPMAVADATSFAMAAAGAEVDLFLQDDASVIWARMSCAP